MLSLRYRTSLPDGFLDCEARDLADLFGGPTMVELSGGDRAPLFVSILQHGNEDSGLGAMQRVLSKHNGSALPRPIMLLIGNVAAAREGKRRLDGQPDYNRVWPGATEWTGSPEAKVMAEVHQQVIDSSAFAAIDLHNNTGRNPHYGVVCTQDPAVLGLAEMFAPRAVRFRGLPGTQTASFSGLVPAITAECGQPGVPANAEAAARLVDAVLHLEALPTRQSLIDDFELFHTLGVVRVRQDVSLGANGQAGFLDLAPQIDDLNFRSVDPGAVFGETDHARPLEVIDENGDDIVEHFFEVAEGQVRLRRSAVPAMLTTDHRLIRQDCLCYLMERLS